MEDKTTEAYEAPAITDIASVHELTLARPRKRHMRTSDGLRMAKKVYVS